ncbi:Remorin [Quillaja saponaria]|uniref:Remorin n=1 Tax=Quillaja saponaria TaxID=32244 RepID=A0AAD7LAB2_QUISA|nr:Remorin [Quillaja saponaria]
MDYERIQKPQEGGGFSPEKLRAILLGVEKKRKEEEPDSIFPSRSHTSDIAETGGGGFDQCKDVDVVSVLPECSNSTTADLLGLQMLDDCRIKDNALASSKYRSQDSSLDYDSGHDNMSMSSSMFEFQKADRHPQRMSLAPFSKPAPSKWDDAQKWIASPTSNRPKTGQAQVQGGQVGPRKVGIGGYGSRQPSMKVVVEVPDQIMAAFDEPDTKMIDSNQTKTESEGQKFVSWEADTFPVADSYVNLSQHNSSLAIQSATTFIPPPSTARSVSMRDMGTEMTPIASQEPSRTGTPVRATTPIRSPISSRSSTPGRAAPASTPTDQTNGSLDFNNNELSDKELQMKTRREIMVLGTQLGKMNIAAWATKEEEDKDASTSLKTIAAGQPAKNIIETRASAWEEAEKAKYIARFKREEMKIQAWENHQKAKSEAEMRKNEVEVERMRGQAHDRLMNKLAVARHKAEEKRAAAEAKRNQRAAKTEEQAEYIRKSGRMPSSFSCCNW